MPGLSQAYTAACVENEAVLRPYLVATLKEIEAELSGERRAGVINLRGSVKELFKNRLTDADVISFFSALDDCEEFRAVEIDLASNRIGAAGVKAVLDFILKPGVVVAALDLSDNDIEEDGAEHLVAALQTQTGLQSLNVSSNDIGAKGTMAIVKALEHNETLQALNIGHTGFDSSVLIALCDMLRHHRNITLTSLGLSRPYVSKRSVPCHTVMEHIGIMLKHNKHITALDLTDHRIDDRGAEILCSYLCTNGSVQTLVLPKNRVGFKGAAAFAALLVDRKCVLVRLNLAQNNIANDGAISLAQGLERNASIASLDLSDNNIEDEGLLQLQLSATNHPTLQHLALFNGNHFGVQAAEYAHEHPLAKEEEGGIEVDFTSFVVDGEVQIARV